ncbi:tripartite tricarboxylate transporter substrate-binding protein [Roseomonas sp. GC11]|uniref:Bug family tripartite tricarboxylate transporter substrate binding protein n=1 Tax=Roseomonas sp. GC11 TaxID=2950546 RepID=UPI00210ACA33|nr:tripartite tricarboxylate transporter substrate-binding protein [Roseomonas sp. GC11]MCQ4159281.1 tripartite tricarboxylate transporter substrate-binding protein [Roseomonas sp. GC11]
MTITRRLLLGGGALACAAPRGPGAARAQSAATQPIATLPDKPIRLLVPNAAGGVADLAARSVGQGLSERLGRPVVVENRPGAGGTIAAQALLAAPADGSTLMVATNAHAISVSLFRSLPFDPLRDFAPVGLMGSFGIAILVAPGSPLRDVAALLAQLRAAPERHPIGTISVGSTQHLAAELFKASAGVDALTVPFTATPALLTSLMRGDVAVAFEIVAPVMGQVRDGALRALAVTSPERSPSLPEVPTLREAGLAGFDVTSWNALVAPARTPPAIIARLNQELNAVLAEPGLRATLRAAGVEAGGGTPEALAALLRGETAKWRAAIERAGIEKQ